MKYTELTVSVPTGIDSLLDEVCDCFGFKKSDLGKIAIVEYLRSIGFIEKNGGNRDG